MQIPQKVADRINEQIKNEFWSSWTYRAMAYACEDMGFKIFAKYFFRQADEEVEHATKLADYLLDQGAKVKLTAIDAPKTDYKSLQEVCETFVSHEKKVTEQVHEINRLARDENDLATENFIRWKVDEQVEEVSSATELHQMVSMAETKGQLFMLENRLWHMIEGK